MKTNKVLVFLILMLQGFCFVGFAQYGLGTNPYNAGYGERIVGPEVRLTNLLLTIISSSEQESDTSSVFVEKPNSGGVLVADPLVPEDVSPESEANPNEFPYFGLEYSQEIYRIEHNPSSTAVIQSTQLMGSDEIIGIEGYNAPESTDMLRWVATKQSLAYTINFENDAELAMAVASKVNITTLLHEKLDFATFEMGDFGNAL